jgi:thioredoxin-like negative regulator of GroEL
MNPDDSKSPPDALMLKGTHCPFCPRLQQSLQELRDSGHIGKLEILNIEENPEVAKALGVRTVPWVRIGPYQLDGLRSTAELREWADMAGSPAGLSKWLDELLGSGRIAEAFELVSAGQSGMDALLDLFADENTQLNTRIGISAIMEDLQGSKALRQNIERLGELTRHADAHIRGDACHYLALSGDIRAATRIRPLLEDADAGVREIASDSLEMLGD